MGLLFPPSILAVTLTGAAAGKFWGGMSRGALKELGEFLDYGETGLVIVGESTLNEYIEKALKRAVKRIRKAAKADMTALEPELGDYMQQRVVEFDGWLCGNVVKAELLSALAAFSLRAAAIIFNIRMGPPGEFLTMGRKRNE